MNARATVSGSASLFAAALAALASVACWALPLALVSAGVTGAWMSNFTLLAPYKSLLIGASLACLAYAGYRIHRTRAAGVDEPECNAPPSRSGPRALFWVVCALVLGAIVSPYLLALLYEA